MKSSLFVFAFLFILLSACKSDKKISTNADDCPQGAPSAIFSDTMQAVTSHRFESENLSSSEYISFKNRLKLELTQSGCENLVQDFRFELPGDYSKETESMFWLNEATHCFRFLAECSTQAGMLSFHNYGRMIAESAFEGMELGEATPVGQGQYLTVDKVVSQNQALITVSLSIGE